MSYGDNPNDGVTICMPPCDEHPPLRDWPMRNLLLGSCPGCSARAYEDRAVGREVRARQLIRSLPDPTGEKPA